MSGERRGTALRHRAAAPASAYVTRAADINHGAADINHAALAEAFLAGENIVLEAFDIRSLDEWHRVVDETLEHFGAIDVHRPSAWEDPEAVALIFSGSRTLTVDEVSAARIARARRPHYRLIQKLEKESRLA